MRGALSRVTAFVPAGAPAIRWCPLQVRAELLTRDVRVPSNIVEAPRHVYAIETQKNHFHVLWAWLQPYLWMRALSLSLCHDGSERCSTELS